MRWVILMAAACDAGMPQVRDTVKSGPAARITAPIDATVAAPAPIDAPIDAPGMLDKYFATTVMATADGAFILIPAAESAGARDAPNLTLEIHDRADRIVDKVLVQAIDELLTPAQMTRRAASADKLLASHAWLPLTEVPEVPISGEPHTQYRGASLDVAWHDEHFTIDQDGKRVVDRAVPKAWRGRKYHLANEGLDCINPDYLGGVVTMPAAKLAVVTVMYWGNDTCWEPGSQLHIISW